MTTQTRLESFLRFANNKGYATTLYRKGQPVGVHIDNAWCYISLSSGIVLTVPQPLKQLFEEFEKQAGVRKKGYQRATYVRPLPRSGDQPVRRRLKRLSPDG